MNLRFRARSDVTTATTTTTATIDSLKPRVQSESGKRSIFSRKSATASSSADQPASFSTSTAIPTRTPLPKMRAGSPSFSRKAGSAGSQTQTQAQAQRRSRVSKEHQRKRTFMRRRHCTASSNQNIYTYTASPFSAQLPNTKPPTLQGIPARFRSLLSKLRHKLHLLKFSFLFQASRLRRWLQAKLHTQQSSGWLKLHILRQKPEPRRPFFPRGPTTYEVLLQEQEQERAKEMARKSGFGSGEEIKDRIRRLSQSTVRSLKKACSLNSERDELREEDRRAMERLDELWRSRDVF